MAEMKKAQAWHAYSPSPCSPRHSPLFAPPCQRRRPSLRTLRFLLLPLRSLALPTFPSPALLSPPPLHSLTLLPPPPLHSLPLPLLSSLPCSSLSPSALPSSPPSLPHSYLHLLSFALTPQPAPRAARGHGGRPPPGGGAAAASQEVEVAAASSPADEARRPTGGLTHAPHPTSQPHPCSPPEFRLCGQQVASHPVHSR